MITLKSHGKIVISIPETTFDKILNIYPDESHINRALFIEARQTREIAFADLKKECETLSLPWQLFLLEPQKLDKELAALDALRKSKFADKLIASRDNEGRGVSLRIADRLIALQDYAKSGVIAKNEFCGSLKELAPNKQQLHIIQFFDIDLERLNKGRKEKTLEYLIGQLEKRNVRVSRGVLDTNKLLPVENNLRKTYRKSSGFVVKDDKVPYIFLPSEVNDDETPGRQILTLIALLSLIGLEQYNVYIEGNFESKLRTRNILTEAFKIASEVLLPVEITERYKGSTITEKLRDELAEKYMLTPSAVVVTLRERENIETDDEFKVLLEGKQSSNKPNNSSHKRTPRIDTSVRKLCGKTTCAEIIEGVRTKQLSSVRAQYLMFGYVNKLKFEKFRANVGL